MRRAHSESGYALLIILIMVTLLSIALAAAVPAIKTQIRREQELELEHRGNEYVKAIQKYYHKFGRYPANIEQLEKANNLRFLRKRYTDPLTGKDDWRIIHLGEAKFPPKLKSNSLAGAQPIGQQLGQNIGVAAGQDVSQLNQPNNTAGLNPASQQQNPQPIGGVGFSGQAGGLTSGTQPGGLGSVGQSGQAIIGVGVPVKKESLRVFNQRQKYDEWEFLYDPRLEALNNSANSINGGQPAGLPSTANGPVLINTNPGPQPQPQPQPPQQQPPQPQ